ncbi:ATP-binding protein [Agrococcus beijingensis]|uniref:ATP-binding protein n=1 Tax=Agrococcus beijingensis TaxID=3068634 RepID=UPI0027426C1F|nr:SbcC/MukB-like Walker B domain-containing protein [Agrococcus sp. REN33]
MLEIPELDVLDPTTQDPTTQDPTKQWRLAEVQLLNWGTFDGLHRVPIARKGQLITGASGSGKSSLLDGIAAVLTPDGLLQFNAAAQGAGAVRGDRSVVSYVRGAWSKAADEEQDRIVSRYLRAGTVVSGVLLRYEDGADAVVTLARLMFLKGTSTDKSDLRDAYLLEQSHLDLDQLRAFVTSQASGIDTRGLQRAYPKAVLTTSGKHAKFYARLGSVLGISGDNALQLLHRTQSAKNLGSLDHLFRTFMLDRPQTFTIADNAVQQFGELDAAHKHVVDLRLQRDALTIMRDLGDRYDDASARATTAGGLRDLVRPFETRERMRLARQERTVADVAAQQARAALDAARDGDAAAAEDHRLALQALDRAGGADLVQLDGRIGDAQREVGHRRAQLERLTRQLADVGIDRAPRDEAQFAELRSMADDELRQPAAKLDMEHPAVQRLTQSTERRKRIDAELQALRRSRSNIDARRLDVRSRLAAHLGVLERAVPFAGELLDVKPEERRWTGAIERVLRPLATTLLVRAEHLAAARRWIDGESLGTRLTYEVVEAEVPSPRSLASDASLVRKVAVGGGGFHDWLAHRLSDQYDIACVETADELDRFARAVTIRGQVKRSATRYEKDDTFAVDDPTRWLLGSSDARHEALLGQHAEAEADVRSAAREVELLQAEVSLSTRRRQQLTQLRSESWEQYDAEAAVARVAQLQRQRLALTSASGDLERTAAAVEEARVASAAARAAADEALATDRAARRQLELLDDAIAGADRTIAADGLGELAAEAVDQLSARFREVRRRITLAELSDASREVEGRLGKERERAIGERDLAAQDFAATATAFKTRWATASADFVARIDDRAGFRALLDTIEANDLPSQEQSFRRLLRDKSSTVVGFLRKELLDAPKEVRERIAPVNESLGRSQFDRDRFLRIRVKLTRGEIVQRFLQELTQIAEGSWDDEDAASAERRFAVLAQLMARLASSDSADRKWRELCLDTRQHVSFLAEVIDRSGLVHETYDSGASLSGGQQQKLVVFCLAAALRYQLTEDGSALPRYGTVILDEAFDKADSTYTRMAMDVFVEFGFHMVLATPLKLLQTLEPYIGGVAVVQNPTQRQSTVDQLGFAEAT